MLEILYIVVGLVYLGYASGKSKDKGETSPSFWIMFALLNVVFWPAWIAIELGFFLHKTIHGKNGGNKNR